MNTNKLSPDSESGSKTDGGVDTETRKSESIISMTQEQFDEVIASRLSRQEKKLKEEHESVVRKLEEETEKSPADENELSIRLKEREETLKAEYQLAIEKQSEETRKTKSELKKLREENRVSVMQNEVVSTLSLTNAISPNDIWLILNSKRLIGVDAEGDVVPVNPATGEPLVSADGKPIGLKTFIEGYLSERPHYVSPSGNRGSGGRGGRNTPVSGTTTGGSITGGSNENGVRELIQNGNFQQLEADMRSKGKLWHGGIIPDWDK